MHRTLVAMAVVLGVTTAGCAADVDDPVPPVVAPEQQRDPPERQLRAGLRDPQALLLDGIEIDRGFGHVPPLQTPDLPAPLPGSD